MTAEHPFDKRIVIFIVSLALFMDALDATIINTAIPAMAQSLNVHPVDLKIALISYLLSLAIFIPISGWVADKYGSKRVFISALVVFTISSIWCGYAQTLIQLVIGRSLQGIGGALMLPVGRLIILRTFHRHEIVTAMNHVVMVVSLGIMLGPFAGGIITDHLSWHWIFFMNIPIGLIAITVASIWFKAEPPRKVHPFDFLGFVLFGGGLACFTFSISYLSNSTGNHQVAIFFMVMAFLMLSEYFIYSRKQHHPIVNASLFQIRTFQVSTLGNLFARLGFGGVPFLLPLLLQIGVGYSAQLSGFLIAPIAFGIIVVKAVSLRVLRLVGYRRLLLWNTILVGLCLWLFRIVDTQTPLYVIAFLTFLFGVLISMQYSGMNSLAYADIAAEDLSAASSIVSTTQQIAQSTGVATSALLLHYYSYKYASPLTLQVFHQTFFALGLITFLSIFIFFKLKSTDGHQMLTHPAQDKIATH